MRFSFQAKSNDHDDELLPIFTKNKIQWGKGKSDAINWYLSPHRSDFTFRSDDILNGVVNATMSMMHFVRWDS